MRTGCGWLRRRPAPGPLPPVLAAVLATSAAGCLPMRLALEKLTPGPETVEWVLEMAPLDLPAEVSHHEAPQPAPLIVTIPTDAWLHGFEVELVDGAGQAVDKSLLHHIKVIDPNRRDLFHPIMFRLVGAGGETRGVRLPAVLGYPLQRGDSLLVTAMVHNPTPQPYSDLRIRVRLTHSPADGAFPEPTPVFPFSAHVTPPGEPSDYDLPPGRSERSWTVRPGVGGQVLGFGGHLHRYGVALRFEDAATGKVLWQTEARRDPDGHILDVPTRTFYVGNGVRLHADREYRVAAVYDNPTGATLVAAAMGTVGGLIRPDRADWPALDREHPLFQYDVEQEIIGGGNGGHGAGGGHRHRGHHH